MDESGNLFDKDGYIETVEISGMDLIEDTDATDLRLGKEVEKATAQDPAKINGAYTGAFVRQTSVQGYMGIYSTMTLPTKANGAMDIREYLPIPNPDNQKPKTTGYLYNTLDCGTPWEFGSSYPVEGGLQYSYQNDNYSGYVRVNGGPLNFNDINGNTVPRFKSNTAFTQNLRYEPANGKIKYYANGVSISGTSQSLVFGITKTFTSSEKSTLRAGRVTGLAWDNTNWGNWNTTTPLGKINTTYNNAKLLKVDGTTQVTLTTSLLDTRINPNTGKIYGTVDWPSEKVNKTPSTGSIGTQQHILDVTN